MNNLLNYDNYTNNVGYPINEEFMNDISKKIKVWWNNFQNKETVLRKIHSFLEKKKYYIISIYLISVVIKYFGYKNNQDLDVVFWIAYSLFCLLLGYIYFGKNRLLRARRNLIMDKMTELRERFKNHNFNEYFYTMIGDKKNINLALDKLIKDGVISKDDILQGEDITIVDLSRVIFSGKYEKEKEIHPDVDPFGEENWGEDEDSDKIELKSMIRGRLITFLTRYYNVRLRGIKDVNDFWDDSIDYTKIYREMGIKDYEEEIKDLL